MDRFLEQLAARLRIPDSEVITGDEVRGWPEGRVEELVKDGVLQEIAPGKTVVCDECDERCSIEPGRRRHPETGALVGLYICTRNPDIGRIEIDLDRLRRWKISKRKLSQLGYSVDGTRNASRQNRQARRENELLLLRAALLAHHGFGTDEVVYQPITQVDLAKRLSWTQSKVSRTIRRGLPQGFWTKYRLACRSDALIGFLTQLDDSVAAEPVDFRPQHPTDREVRTADRYH